MDDFLILFIINLLRFQKILLYIIIHNELNENLKMQKEMIKIVENVKILCYTIMSCELDA